MRKYKRIEITAFRRRVTVSSGEMATTSRLQREPTTEEGVWLNDADSGDPIAFESEEGQLILAEAVRSLERRLSPEARAAISDVPPTFAPQGSIRTGFYFKLQSFYQFICPNVLRFTRKEK